MTAPSSEAREHDEREQRPWWVGVVGLLSLVLGIALTPLILLTFPTLGRLSSHDLGYWALFAGFCLSPAVLAWSFVLTTLRSEQRHWRRGGYIFVAVIVYLVVGAVAGSRL